MSENRPLVPLDGQLDDTALTEVLSELQRESLTGILTVHSEDDIISITVERGAIVGADALNETQEEGVGAALSQEGILTVAQVSGALRRVRAERLRLGDVLQADDLLPRADYLAAIRRYTFGLMGRCLSWDEGDFKFYAGDEVSFEKGFDPIAMVEILPELAPVLEQDSEAAFEAPVDGPVEALDEVGEPAFADPFGVDEPTGALAGDDGPEADRPAGGVSGWLSGAPRWISWLTPTLVVVLLATVAVSRPNSIIYPFYWLETERLEIEKQRRMSAYSKIDRAAKTFFLLEGRFPEDLQSLVALGLLSRDDAIGSSGRSLSYRAGDRGYVIRDDETDGTDPGVNRAEAMGGDFFLDPEFLALNRRRDTTPLVLLD